MPAVPVALTPLTPRDRQELIIMDVDPRGLRFAAWVTTVVLAVVLATGSAWLAAAQALVFAVGAFAGLRFAQGVGFVFGLVGAVGYATGVSALGVVAIGLALAAAFLNAAFGFCLGCETYLLIRRFTAKSRKGVNA